MDIGKHVKTVEPVIKEEPKPVIIYPVEKPAEKPIEMPDWMKKPARVPEPELVPA